MSTAAWLVVQLDLAGHIRSYCNLFVTHTCICTVRQNASWVSSRMHVLARAHRVAAWLSKRLNDRYLRGIEAERLLQFGLNKTAAVHTDTAAFSGKLTPEFVDSLHSSVDQVAIFKLQLEQALHGIQDLNVLYDKLFVQPKPGEDRQNLLEWFIKTQNECRDQVSQALAQVQRKVDKSELLRTQDTLEEAVLQGRHNHDVRAQICRSVCVDSFAHILSQQLASEIETTRHNISQQLLHITRRLRTAAKVQDLDEMRSTFEATLAVLNQAEDTVALATTEHDGEHKRCASCNRPFLQYGRSCSPIHAGSPSRARADLTVSSPKPRPGSANPKSLNINTSLSGTADRRTGHPPLSARSHRQPTPRMVRNKMPEVELPGPWRTRSDGAGGSGILASERPQSKPTSSTHAVDLRAAGRTGGSATPAYAQGRLRPKSATVLRRSSAT